jgi:hypothetical protein
MSTKIFTSTLRNAWETTWLRQVISDVQARPQEETFALISESGLTRRYTIDMGRYTMNWLVERNADGKISDMRFQME